MLGIGYKPPVQCANAEALRRMMLDRARSMRAIAADALWFT
jgi:hypothetical protein